MDAYRSIFVAHSEQVSIPSLYWLLNAYKVLIPANVTVLDVLIPWFFTMLLKTTYHPEQLHITLSPFAHCAHRPATVRWLHTALPLYGQQFYLKVCVTVSGWQQAGIEMLWRWWHCHLVISQMVVDQRGPVCSQHEVVYERWAKGERTL